MNSRELLQLPNLVSLSRIVLAPAIGYYLWRDTLEATIVAALLVILAGITDGLDGYLARRMNRVTPLGIALDPIADKLFAVLLVISLMLYRQFPAWLAAAIVGRDLLIVVGGALLRSKRPMALPPNLTGKWTFASLAVLLGAYVIRFEFSIALMTPIVVTLLVASLVSYGRIFYGIKVDEASKPFVDRPVFKATRYMLLTGVVVAHVIMFYVEFLK